MEVHEILSVKMLPTLVTILKSAHNTSGFVCIKIQKLNIVYRNKKKKKTLFQIKMFIAFYQTAKYFTVKFSLI